jgi:hypothetical protein
MFKKKTKKKMPQALKETTKEKKELIKSQNVE